jgi:hypothetical protein
MNPQISDVLSGCSTAKLTPRAQQSQLSRSPDVT